MILESAHKAFLYTLTSFFTQGLNFGLWFILAWYLVPSQIGLFALVMFVLESFSALAVMGLDAALTRFYHTEEGVGAVLANALVILAAAGLFALLLFFSTAASIPVLIPELTDVLETHRILFILLILVNTGANVAQVHYTARREASVYIGVQVLRSTLFVSVSLALVHLGFDIWGVFHALAWSSFAVCLFFLVRERRLADLNGLSWRLTTAILSYGFPMMLYSVLGIIITYFGRLVLATSVSLSTLGIYSFFLMITLQVNGMWGSLNRAWTPEVFSSFLDDREPALREIADLTFLVSFLYLILLIVVILIGNYFIFPWIFKKIYADQLVILYILLLGPLFTGIYTVSYPLFYYENKTPRILLVSLVLSGLSILTTFGLVRVMGETGAALSYVLMSIVAVLLYLLAFYKTARIPASILSWTFLLSLLTCISIGILLKGWLFAFLGLHLLAALLAFRMGRLSVKVRLFHKWIKNRMDTACSCMLPLLP